MALRLTLAPRTQLWRYSIRNSEEFTMKYSCFALVTALLFSVSLFAQVNPVPTINGPVSPQAVVPGSSNFLLTVRGAGFVPGAFVNWTDSPRITTFISFGDLQAQILSSDVALAGSALITVTNPPPGGGLSSSSNAMVEIHQPISKPVFARPHIFAMREGGLGVLTYDLNGDNILDLLQINNGFEILVGTGVGSFSGSSSLQRNN